MGANGCFSVFQPTIHPPIFIIIPISIPFRLSLLLAVLGFQIRFDRGAGDDIIPLSTISLLCSSKQAFIILG